MEIPSVNCGKVEGNLQSGGRNIQKNFIGNMSVIYLWKVRWYFVGESVGDPSVIGNHFYRHSVGIVSVICYKYTL